MLHVGQEVISRDFLTKFRSRGVERVWIHKDDLPAFEAYLKAREAAAPPRELKTEAGKKIVELVADPAISERERTAMVAKTARAAMAEVAAATTPAEQAKANEKAREVVRDVLEGALDKASKEVRSLASEIWKLADIDPDLEHSANVSTYAVLFAMAFGRIDQELIADIAIAGLLHDAGISQVTAAVTSIPWKEMKPEDLNRYSRHVNAGNTLVDLYAPEIPARVKAMIAQHHEKFDGTGYPNHLEGFKVNDIAQLLGMADMLDSMSGGQWDGQKRALQDTFQTLEKLEKKRTFPEHFNPEVFGAVMKWMKNAQAMDSAKEAAKIVERTTEKLVKNAA
jgi:HD-GYP domain-containing protein (c-di-GMP phosphodiesterase class II)